MKRNATMAMRFPSTLVIFRNRLALLTSSGKMWRRLRRLEDPVLHPQATAATVASGFTYGPGGSNLDSPLLKDLRSTESRSFEIRLESLNAFDHAQCHGAAVINRNIDSPAFGKVVSAQNPQ